MTVGLIIVLALVLILPFTFRVIEHNLEYFLFTMGLLATIISGSLSVHLISHIFGNRLLYFITAAVLIAGLLFNYSIQKIHWMVGTILKRIPLKLFIFAMVTVLGLASSLITAIIAALVLVEILHALPLKHKTKVKLAIVSCFSIGLGAVLTPIGEPLSTIVVSSLKADFWYLFHLIGVYVVPGVIAMGLLSIFILHRDERKEAADSTAATSEETAEAICFKEESVEIKKEEELKAVFIRAFKIFVFVVALELLGTGFKPLVNTYIIHLDSRLLYWINMTSAVLDNATLAAAEVSPSMTVIQIKAILMGLLISGGMLIPGNIPNIISAGKLNIKSREWAITGAPIGLALLVIYFVAIFLF